MVAGWLAGGLGKRVGRGAQMEDYADSADSSQVLSLCRCGPNSSTVCLMVNPAVLQPSDP